MFKKLLIPYLVYTAFVAPVKVGAQSLPADSQPGRAAGDAQNRVPILRGGTEDQASPMTTVQKKGQAVSADFSSLSPSIDPALLRQLEAQEAVERELAPMRATAQMDSVLSRPAPILRGDVLKRIPTRIPIRQDNRLAPLLDKAIDAQLARAKVPVDPRSLSLLQAELDKARNHYAYSNYAYSNYRVRSSDGLFLPGNLGRLPADAEKVLDAEAARARQRNNYYAPAADACLNGELHRSRPPEPAPSLDKEVKAELARSKPYMDAAIAHGESAMEAVYRRLPELDTAAKVIGKTGFAENDISWDKWYARVAAISEPRLLAAMDRHHSPSGANTVIVTVEANHHVTVRLIKGNNQDFNAATLEAYASLDGLPDLAFPVGSFRTAVSFYIDNKHQISGDVSGVVSKPFVGDRESFRQR